MIKSMLNVSVEEWLGGEYHVNVESDGSAAEVTVNTAMLIDAICRNSIFKEEGISEERAFHGIMLAINQLAQCDAKILKWNEEDEYEEEV